MAERDATFSEADAGRIARAVRHVERTAGDLSGPRPHRPAPTRKRHVGVAEIISNDGEGAYTITAQRWNPDTPAYQAATSPEGLIAASARDFLGRTDGVAGDLVPFWDEYDTAGTMILFINAVAGGTHASPLALAPGVVADADVDEPQADSWDRANQGVYDGFTFAIQRVSFDDAGDEILHGQYRLATVDSAGRFSLVGAETGKEYVIDTPGYCPADVVTDDEIAMMMLLGGL